MASTIQIKSGTGSAVPSSLLQGELALNVSSGKLYYGTSGSNSVSSSFEFDKLTVGEATITQLTSSIVSSSIIYSSGSNIFGDATTDSHTFTGNITASSNISSSKTGKISAGSGSYHVLQGDTSQATSLYVDGHITASGDISSSADVIGVTGSFDYINIGDTIGRSEDPDTRILFTNDDINITVGGVNMIDFTEGGTDEITFNEEGVDIDVRMEGNTDQQLFHLNAGTDKVGIGTDSPSSKLQIDGDLTATHITSSGNISSSGTLYMGTPGVPTTHTFYGRIRTVGSEVNIGDGHISMSGNISGSIGSTGSFDHIITSTGSIEFRNGGTKLGTLKYHPTEGLQVKDSSGNRSGITTQHITSSGNISSSGVLYMGTPGARQIHTVHGRLNVVGSDITIGDGHISMSGNLIMTGSISGSSSTTASFAHIITNGETIEFKNGNSKLGAIKFSSANGLQTLDSAGNSGKIKTAHVTAISELYSPIMSELLGPVTASVISSSTEVITPTLKGGGTTTGLIVAGFADIQGAITASGNISSSAVIQGSKLIISKSPPVTIENGHISASGNISASLSVRALTGSFGTGTTHVHDGIQTAGYISSSDEFIGKTATFSQRIKVKGSDITLEKGHISASGNISSSGYVQALTGSFGTGTTTITDFIHTTGNITGSYIEAPHVKSDLLEVKPGGKLRVKGSDITLEHGNISMSGNMLMTGSITAGGNVTAGTNGTGSFDHIITLDDTIEFRNKSNRNQVKGYMKFDPEKGLIHLSGSGANAVNTLQSIKIKPTDFYPIGVAVGGKGAGGVVTLQPKNGNSMVIASAAGVYTCEVKIPKGLTPGNTVIYGSDTSNTYKIYAGTLANNNTATDITPAVNNIAVGTIANGNTMMDKASKAGITWNSNNHYLIIEVTTNGADGIYGGYVLIS